MVFVGECASFPVKTQHKRSRSELVVQSPAAAVWSLPTDVVAALALEVEEFGAVSLG